MFFLTKLAENAVILIPDSNSITFAGSLESSAQHMKIFYEPWLLRIAAITVHLSVMSPADFVVECQHRTKDKKNYLVTKAIVATF